MMIKTHNAQQAGAYKATAVDTSKAAADFRILDVSCRMKRIAWRDGTQQDVTAAQLKKLQAAHSWVTDF